MYLSKTPNVFKSGFLSPTGITTLDFPLWTPSSGKRFRLLRYIIEVSNITQIEPEAHTAVVQQLMFKDGATSIGLGHSVWVNLNQGYYNPAVGSYTIDRDLGNGYLSTAADNVLYINCTTYFNTLTGGGFTYQVHGTEE